MADSDKSDSDGTEQEIYRKWTLTAKEPIRSVNSQPKFEIVLQRKFEIPQLCEVFFNKYAKCIYLLMVCLLAFIECWLYATVASSAWATNIPFHSLGAVEMCSGNAFFNHILPTSGCLYAYYLCLGLFAVIVVTLSFLDLKEQAFLQVLFGLLRFFVIGAVITYCIVHLVQGGNHPCLDDNAADTNFTFLTPSNLDSILSIVAKFDPNSWLLSIPVFVFAFMIHNGIPSLTHPIKQKQFLHWLILAMVVVAFMSYLSLGVALSLWFRAAIQETCTLNWVSLI